MMFLVGCGCQHFASGLLQRLAEVVTSGGPVSLLLLSLLL